MPAPPTPPDFTADPDFRDTVARLRAHLRLCSREGRRTDIAGERSILLDAEAPAVAAAVAYLYDHLAYHEQWLQAARLLAYCIPACAIGEPRVRATLDSAVKLAAPIEDPELERALVRVHAIQQIEDPLVLHPNTLTPRARYWLSVARLSGAAVALEYGCDHGSHVLAAARSEPHIEWLGTDPREAQVSANRDQARRLGLENAHFYPNGDEDTIGVADCIGVLDTLEHTVHPDELMAAAEACGAPGAVVVVTMPCGPWALHDDAPPDPSKGEPFNGGHIATNSLPGLAAYLAGRGHLLQGQVLPGPDPAEGNSTVCVTYRLPLRGNDHEELG